MGGGVLPLLVIFVTAVVVGVTFFSFLRGLCGEREGWGGGRAEKQSHLVQSLTSRTQGQGSSCFCVQCELVFTADDSGCGLSAVCVSELFNFVLCLYEEIFMHTSPSVCLTLINITLQSSAAVSLESNSFGCTWAMSKSLELFTRLRRRRQPPCWRQQVPNSWVIKSQL